jgi:hypothetical protein
MNNEPMHEVESVEYYEGFYSFRNQSLEVLMDEATFNSYMQAYLVLQGIETRKYSALVAYAADVSRQHFEAEQALHNPDYWLQICDPRIRIIRRDSTPQQAQAEEAEKISGA